MDRRERTCWICVEDGPTIMEGDIVEGLIHVTCFDFFFNYALRSCFVSRFTSEDTIR